MSLLILCLKIWGERLDKEKLLAVARGEIVADLVIKNAKIINVFTKEIEEGVLAVSQGVFVGIGDYQGEVELDLQGAYLSPGFIDGHVHIESSMLVPSRYASLVVPRGTTAVIADCHEIANVCGTKGIDFMLADSLSSPLDVFMMIPSCVPSTEYETSGAVLKADDISRYLHHPLVLGLGEMMDYPGTINGDKDVLAKLDLFREMILDGHAPSVKDKELNAYVVSGIKTDHECVEPDELLEKVRRGMYVHLREGSQTKNVKDLLVGLNEKFFDRVTFCSDDLHPSDIKSIGHIDNNINIAISSGIEPISAISMATINIANCYNIENVGAIAPGYKADFVVFDDLSKIIVKQVYKAGKLVAMNYQPLFESLTSDASSVSDTMNIDISNLDLQMILKSDLVNIIGLVKNNVTTKRIVERIKLDSGIFEARDNPDLLKLCVLERHKFTGNIGKAIVKGYGLKSGAIAMTIAHDSHNLIVIGDNDSDMMVAVNKVKDINGGIVICSDGQVLEHLALKVGGIMSLDNPDFVEAKLIRLEEIARKLGVSKDIEDPFLQLAFLSLPVIPEIKLTDLGLFDVERFKLITNEVGDE